MSALDDMCDDEVRARLGLAPLGRPMTMEERIEAHMVCAMPEPYDPETEGTLELMDMTDGAPPHMQPRCTCSASRWDGDDGWDRDCPVHGVEADQ
ncbi:hypothetical protein PBI_INDLOVU_66 [Mycobacterium phage Indlovu]|nr:hypothetical protein PBI_INDLOVU_66 [Mycobacterium phage Indlovu]